MRNSLSSNSRLSSNLSSPNLVVLITTLLCYLNILLLISEMDLWISWTSRIVISVTSCDGHFMILGNGSYIISLFSSFENFPSKTFILFQLFLFFQFLFTFLFLICRSLFPLNNFCLSSLHVLLSQYVLANMSWFSHQFS